jgi:signal peptidase II
LIATVTPSRTFRLVAISLILICTAGCDQVTKHIARMQLSQSNSATMPGRFLQFTLAENPGAFLSLGASLPQSARITLTACIGLTLALLLAHIIRKPNLRPPLLLGLTLICAGGLSNLIDRLLRDGLVTDFMILRLGPLHTGIFNFADLAIVTGALLVALAASSPSSSKTSRQPT